MVKSCFLSAVHTIPTRLLFLGQSFSSTVTLDFGSSKTIPPFSGDILFRWWHKCSDCIRRMAVKKKWSSFTWLCLLKLGLIEDDSFVGGTKHILWSYPIVVLGSCQWERFIRGLITKNVVRIDCIHPLTIARVSIVIQREARSVTHTPITAYRVNTLLSATVGRGKGTFVVIWKEM